MECGLQPALKHGSLLLLDWEQCKLIKKEMYSDNVRTQFMLCKMAGLPT